MHTQIKRIHILTITLTFFVAMLAMILAVPQTANAAACTVPTTDYGTATTTVSIPATGSYRVWSRIMAPDTTNNSYLLEVDGNTCYTVGDSAIPANTWTWVNYQGGNTSSLITANLSAGSHTVKMIGREANVKLDRVLFLSDTSCVPTGTGDNCAVDAPEPTGSPDLVVQSITTSPATPKAGDQVTFIATVKNQGTAATKVGINHGVRFDVNGTVRTWSGNNTSVSIPAGGTANLTANAGVNGSTWPAQEGTFTVLADVDDLGLIEESNEDNNSFTRSLTVSATQSPTPTKQGDLNNDSSVNIFDLSILLSNWGKTGSNLTGDINTDSKVDVFDMSILLSKWGS